MNRSLASVRVVAITDASLLGDDPRAAIARAVDGCAPGSVMIQVRAKHLDGAALLALARVAAEAAPNMPIAINDRVDVALAFVSPARLTVVHLPEDGLSIDEARSLGVASSEVAPFLVGASRHTVEGAGVAVTQGANLVQLGPIWETPGKGPALGTDVLHATRLHIEHTNYLCRLVAVGGIDSVDRARDAVRAGAHAVALIRAAWTGDSLAPFVAAVTDSLAQSDR